MYFCIMKIFIVYKIITAYCTYINTLMCILSYITFILYLINNNDVHESAVVALLLHNRK